MYIRLPSSSTGTISGTILECDNFLSLNIVNSQRLVFWQTGDNICEWSDLGGVIGKWVHLSVSYSNYNIQQGQFMAMRIFINGKVVSQCKINNAASVTREQGKGICSIGNAAQVAIMYKAGATPPQSDQALSMDIAYFQIFSSPRTQNFTIQHYYPQSPNNAPQKSLDLSSLLYLRLDSKDYPSTDYYLNRTNPSLLLYNLDYLQLNEPRDLCESYAEPLSVMTVHNGINFTNLQLRDQDSQMITNYLLIDFWVKILNSTQVATQTEVTDFLDIQSILKMKLSRDTIQVQIDNKIVDMMQGQKGLLGVYREWTYVAIQISQSQIALWRNGVKLSTLSINRTTQPVSSIIFSFTPNLPQTAFQLFSLRLQSSTYAFSDEYLSYTYIDGTNQDNLNKRIQPNNYVIIDFKFTQLYLRNQQYSRSQLTSGTFLSDNNYQLNFTTAKSNLVDFQFDNQVSGGQPKWKEGACDDKRWFPQFTINNKKEAVMKQTLMTIGPEFTVEFWFKPIFNSGSGSNETIIQVDDKLKTRYVIGITRDNQINCTFNVADIKQFQSIIFNETLQAHQWYSIVFQTSAIQNQTRVILGNFKENNFRRTQIFNRRAFGDLGAPIYANTYLGNSPNAERPYSGLMRELRIWKEFRNDSMLTTFKNIEVPFQHQGTLLYYYKFAGDTDYFRITDANFSLNSGQNDFILSTSLKMYESPIRYVQDLPNYMIICPYGTIPNLTPQLVSVNNHSCQSPTALKSNLVSYIDYQSQANPKIIVDTQVNFTHQFQPPEAYNFTFSLIDIEPYDRLIMEEKSVIFNFKSLFNSNESVTHPVQTIIDAYKLDTRYQYLVEMRIASLYYPNNQEYTQISQTWVDIKCPSFTIDLVDTLTDTILVYNTNPVNNTKPGKQIRYLVNLTSYINCFTGGNTFLNQSSLKFLWNSSNTTTELTQYFDISLLSGNKTLALVSKKTVPENIFFIYSIIMSFNNTLMPNRLQQNSKQVKIKLVRDSQIQFIINSNGIQNQDSTFIFRTTQELILNASNTYILDPTYAGRQIRYQVTCPASLFKTQTDYNKWCFIDYRGFISIPSSAFSTSFNIIPSLRYPFILNATLKGAETVSANKTIFISWQQVSNNDANCPNVTIPEYFNISKIENFTKVFPSYNLFCQKEGYVQSYQIQTVEWKMNTSNSSYFRNKSNEESISTMLEMYDFGTWAQVKNESRQFLNQGEVIPFNLTIKVLSNNQEERVFVLQSKFKIIHHEYVVKASFNFANRTYSFNDTISINITGTYDPEEPGTRLQYQWICPSYITNMTLCPPQSSTQIITFSIEQKIALLWKYGEENFISLQIKNPRTLKIQQIKLSFYLTQPSLSIGTGLCPYFDFTSSNTLFISKNSSDDSFYIVLTNNITDLSIQYPQVRLTCGTQQSLSNKIIGLQLQDLTGKLLQENQTGLMYPYQQLSNTSSKMFPLKLSADCLKELESGKEYPLIAYLYYRTNVTNTSTAIVYYSKSLIIKRNRPENILIAELTPKEYIQIDDNSTQAVVISGEKSRDNGNLGNRNFSYRWVCSELVPKEICPTYSNQSFITLNSTYRSLLKMNISGRLYSFSLQIYDHQRTSQWVTTQLFIKPHTSQSCLIIDVPQSNHVQLYSQQQYPLMQFINVTEYCPNITYQNYGVRIKQKQSSVLRILEDKNNQIGINVFDKGPKSGFAIIPDSELIRDQANLIVEYYIQYHILNALHTESNFSFNLTIEKDQRQAQLLKRIKDTYIEGPRVINLEKDKQLILTLKSITDQNMTQIKWDCGSYIDCSFEKTSKLSISLNDIQLPIYTQLINTGLPFRIQANNSDVYVSFTKAKSFNDCHSEHSQQYTDYLDVTKPLLISLICNSSNPSLKVTWTLLNLNTSITYPITPSTQTHLELSDVQSFISLDPYTLSQNNLYFVNASFYSDDDAQHVFTYTLLLNSTYPHSQQLLSTAFNLQLFESTNRTGTDEGFYYQDLFKVTGVQGTKDMDNLFYSVRILNNEQQWYTLVPRQVNSSYIQIINVQISIPMYSKMVLDVRNNRGEIRTQEIRDLPVYRNQSATKEEQLGLKMLKLEDYNLSNLTITQVITLNSDIYQYLQLNQINDNNGKNKRVLSEDKSVINIIQVMNVINSLLKRANQEQLDKKDLCRFSEEPCFDIIANQIKNYHYLLSSLNSYGLINYNQTMELLDNYVLRELNNELLLQLLSYDHQLAQILKDTLSILNGLFQRYPFLPTSKINTFQKQLFLYLLSLLPPGATYNHSFNNSTLLAQPLQPLIYFTSNNISLTFSASSLLDLQYPSNFNTHLQTVILNITKPKDIVEILFQSSDLSLLNFTEPIELQKGFHFEFNQLEYEILRNSTCGYRQNQYSKWKYANQTNITEVETKKKGNTIQCESKMLTGQFKLINLGRPIIEDEQAKEEDEIKEIKQFQWLYIILTVSGMTIVFIEIMAFYAECQRNKRINLYAMINTNKTNKTQKSKSKQFWRVYCYVSDLLNLTKLTILQVSILVRSQILLQNVLLKLLILSAYILYDQNLFLEGSYSDIIVATILLSLVTHLPEQLITNWLYYIFSTETKIEDQELKDDSVSIPQFDKSKMSPSPTIKDIKDYFRTADINTNREVTTNRQQFSSRVLFTTDTALRSNDRMMENSDRKNITTTRREMEEGSHRFPHPWNTSLKKHKLERQDNSMKYHLRSPFSSEDDSSISASANNAAMKQQPFDKTVSSESDDESVSKNRYSISQIMDTQGANILPTPSEGKQRIVMANPFEHTEIEITKNQDSQSLIDKIEEGEVEDDEESIRTVNQIDLNMHSPDSNMQNPSKLLIRRAASPKAVRHQSPLLNFDQFNNANALSPQLAQNFKQVKSTRERKHFIFGPQNDEDQEAQQCLPPKRFTRQRNISDVSDTKLSSVSVDFFRNPQSLQGTQTLSNLRLISRDANQQIRESPYHGNTDYSPGKQADLLRGFSGVGNFFAFKNNNNDMYDDVQRSVTPNFVVAKQHNEEDDDELELDNALFENSYKQDKQKSPDAKYQQKQTPQFELNKNKNNQDEVFEAIPFDNTKLEENQQNDQAMQSLLLSSKQKLWQTYTFGIIHSIILIGGLLISLINLWFFKCLSKQEQDSDKYISIFILSAVMLMVMSIIINLLATVVIMKQLSNTEDKKQVEFSLSKISKTLLFGGHTRCQVCVDLLNDKFSHQIYFN